VDLSSLARTRGLSRLADFLELDENRPVLEPPADADRFLLADPSHGALAVMARRGLEPRLVSALLPAFAARPLERGLFAWDVLNRSLLDEDEAELRDELRAAASAVRDALPGPGELGVPLAAVSAAELLARHAPRTDSTESLLEAAKDHDLGALAALHARGNPLVDRPEARESVRAFARLLSFAHAPTLASLYLDWLWRGLGHEPAFFDLCELLLDAGAAERIPLGVLTPEDEKEPETARFLEYVLYRVGMQKKQLVDTYALFKQTKKKREAHWRKSAPEPGLQLVEVELGAYYREATTPTAIVDEICRARSDWRYAAEMRVVAIAAAAPSDSGAPLDAIQRYLENFGNRFSAWWLPLKASQPGAPWRVRLGRLLAREAFHLPHERDVWKALLPLVGEGDLQPAAAEIDARIAEQSSLG
jgi:hypothetical protein